jgi:hypothetical protein
MGQYLEEHGIGSIADIEKLLEPSFYVVLPVSILERKDISPTSKIVYAEICALARKSGYCFASNAHLAERTGNSERTITRAVTQLAKKNMIALQMSTSRSGISRTIVLAWGVDKVSRPPRQSGYTPLAKVSRVEIDTVEINIRDNNTPPSGGKLGNELIDLFKEVNPSYKQFFKRKPQHEAAERLIEEHGFEKVSKVVAILPKSNRIAYLPTITSPCQLEEKWATLEAGLAKKKNESSSKGRGFA